MNEAIFNTALILFGVIIVLFLIGSIIMVVLLLKMAIEEFFR